LPSTRGCREKPGEFSTYNKKRGQLHKKQVINPPLLGNYWLKYLGNRVNIDFEMNNITSQNYTNQIKE